MKELVLPAKLSQEITVFTRNLKEIYQENLISVILYGSAASGEFVASHSNINILVILKSTELALLKQASVTVKRFKNLAPLFLTKEYILSSTDVFPIEFLDMQENYNVLFGEDVLKSIHVDLKNLRFQCEQELKVKLLNLKQLYLGLNAHPVNLKVLLFKSFTSSLHILRNLLRLKGMQPPYQKKDLLKELSTHFKINIACWEKILAAKSKKMRIGKAEIEELFIAWVDNLETIIQDVDAL
jgi:predicted nucleotidyltransferase